MARLLVLFALAGCEVGSLPPGDGGGNGLCEQFSTNIPAGHHNPGLTCIAGGCHDPAQLGIGAPPYSYGGTLFSSAAGGTPVPGATILITLGGVTKKVITADNGNFWLEPGAAGLDAPTAMNLADTKASGCPDEVPMLAKLNAGHGNCNSCHVTGGTTSPIHLP